MYEIEDISLGHHDLFAVKHSPSVNGYPSSIMDVYLGSTTFQEMLDIDIKSEMDNVFGGQAEISFDFADMPDIDDSACTNDPNIWFSSNSNHSISNLFECRNEGASKMVNPNSVMPLLHVNSRVLTPTLASSQNPDIETPSPKRSHLQFSPASIEAITNNIKQENIIAVRKDLSDDLDKSTSDEVDKPPNSSSPFSSSPSLTTNSDSIVSFSNNNNISNKSLPKPVHILTTKSLLTPRSTTQHISSDTIKITTTTAQRPISVTTSMVHHLSTPPTITTSPRHAQSMINRKVKKFQDEEENPFPKPTYSYSCLIAMALKNSRTGSLPVSEIYNFMCEHFPYFKTAPNGWKNSVRHNLSLNKCFEKIEKPAVSGSQRKGCLWAMHPDKISKMDEEVQKWSRKDPAAIRRAMIYPDQLEALERGELKYGSDTYGDYSGSGGSDSEIETEPEEIEPDSNVTIREDMTAHSDLIEVNSLGDSCDEASLTDYDTELCDNIYDGEENLRVEIALAQELFNCKEKVRNTSTLMSNGNDRITPSKRLRTNGGATVVDYMYQPITTGRRKAPLLVRNNSNTSFIEIIGE